MAGIVGVSCTRLCALHPLRWGLEPGCAQDSPRGNAVHASLWGARKLKPRNKIIRHRPEWSYFGTKREALGLLVRGEANAYNQEWIRDGPGH